MSPGFDSRLPYSEGLIPAFKCINWYYTSNCDNLYYMRNTYTIQERHEVRMVMSVYAAKLIKSQRQVVSEAYGAKRG